MQYFLSGQKNLGYVFCNEEHPSSKFDKVTNKEILKKSSGCILCLKSGH